MGNLQENISSKVLWNEFWKGKLPSECNGTIIKQKNWDSWKDGRSK